MRKGLCFQLSKAQSRFSLFLKLGQLPDKPLQGRACWRICSSACKHWAKFWLQEPGEAEDRSWWPSSNCCHPNFCFCLHISSFDSFKDTFDCAEATQIIQDKCPISGSLNESHLQSPFAVEGSISTSPGDWDMDIFGGPLFCHPHHATEEMSSPTHNAVLKSFPQFPSRRW